MVASTSPTRTFKKTLEMGCDTTPCYIPKYGDVSDVHLPWAYASIVDPSYFPKGAILEQLLLLTVLHYAGLATIARYLLQETKQTSYLTTYAGSFNTRSAAAEEVLSGATKVGGSTLMQSLTTGTTTYPHTPRERNDIWASWR